MGKKFTIYEVFLASTREQPTSNNHHPSNHGNKISTFMNVDILNQSKKKVKFPTKFAEKLLHNQPSVTEQLFFLVLTSAAFFHFLHACTFQCAVYFCCCYKS